MLGERKNLNEAEFRKMKNVTNVDFLDKQFFEDLENDQSRNNEKIM